jgi:hypothetical protein
VVRRCRQHRDSGLLILALWDQGADFVVAGDLPLRPSSLRCGRPPLPVAPDEAEQPMHATNACALGPQPDAWGAGALTFRRVVRSGEQRGDD